MSNFKYGALEQQAEYVRSRQQGYGFTGHGRWWHWLYTVDQINPVDRERLVQAHPKATHFIWSLDTIYERLIITPCTSTLDWTQQAHSIAAHSEERK